jgi:hypothetical protein
VTGRAEPTDDDDSEEAFPPPVCLLEARPEIPLLPLAEGLLLASTISAITGEDEAYKSTFALAVAVAVAGGLPVFGVFRTVMTRQVLIVSEEDELAVIQNRVLAIITGMGWQQRERVILGNLRVHALDGLQLGDLKSQTHLLELQRRHGIELMIFDPLADLIRGQEQSADDARPVKRFWRQLVQRECAVLVVHHFGKPREGASDGDRVRGTSAWKSAFRTLYRLKRADDAIEVTCLKASRTRRPEPFQVDVEVLTVEDNPAMWAEARLTIAARSGNWTIRDRRALTPSERKALTALEDFREEPLSWTRWVAVTGIPDSTLSDIRRRLLDLRYVQLHVVGQNRFRKPQHAYSITGEGTAALIPGPDTETPARHRTRHRTASQSPDTETPPPPLGGACVPVSVEGASEPPDTGFPHLAAEDEPGDAWEPEL